MKAWILLRKLSFLAKLLSCDEDNLIASVFCTISTENIYNISLVQQCKWLQGELKCEQILEKCLSDPSNAPVIVRDAKKAIYCQNWGNTTQSAAQHPSLKHITCSEFICITTSWCRIWDLALDRGERGMRLVQCLFKSLCHPLFGDRRCPHCSSHIASDITFFEHLCQQHIKFEAGNLCTVLNSDDDSIFSLAMQILNLSF